MSTEKKPAPPETLPFLFTPVETAEDSPARDNPHIKKTTDVRATIEKLNERFGQTLIEVTVYAGEHTILVDRNRIVEIAEFLKSELGYNYLSDLGGIDRFTEEDRYEVFYNLVSIEKGKRLRLKIRVDEESMSAPTVTSVYRAADWNERECYDMFGIQFDGHPDMRRMFMPEDFEYHPLRKEFPLLGVPGSLPLPPQTPEAALTMDPFPAAHGSKPVKSFEEEESQADL